MSNPKSSQSQNLFSPPLASGSLHSLRIFSGSEESLEVENGVSSHRAMLPRRGEKIPNSVDRTPDKYGFIPSHFWFREGQTRSSAEQSVRRNAGGGRGAFNHVTSYAPDWIVTIGLFLIFAFVDKIDGFRREFSLKDTSIQHTYAVHERVPVWLLIILAGLVPFIVITLIGLVVMRNFRDFHNGTLGLILSWAMTTVVTDVVKITVGRPRPDLIDRCQPLSGSQDAAVYGLSTSQICTQTSASILKDGFRSFPSGHSSTSFCGLGFLALYLAGKLHLFDQRGYAIKAWICVLPLIAAALIGISRSMDYRHHATDIIAGSILGMCIASFCYSFYYPSLSSPLCHLPYAPRTSQNSGDSRVALEEDLEHGGNIRGEGEPNIVLGRE